MLITDTKTEEYKECDAELRTRFRKNQSGMSRLMFTEICLKFQVDPAVAQALFEGDGMEVQTKAPGKKLATDLFEMSF